MLVRGREGRFLSEKGRSRSEKGRRKQLLESLAAEAATTAQGGDRAAVDLAAKPTSRTRGKVKAKVKESDEDETDELVDRSDLGPLASDEARTVVGLIEGDIVGLRLDVAVARLARVSRERAQHLIDEGHVKVEGLPALKGFRLEAGQSFVFHVPAPVTMTCQPEDLPLTLVHQDKSIVIVDKPRGLLTHPVGRTITGTLVNALLHHCKHLSGINGVLRPGIVHRLDRETSGLMVVACSDAAHRSLAAQFAERKVEKIYLAVVMGCPTHARGLIDVPIGRDPAHRTHMRVDARHGREARTEYRVVSKHGRYSLLELTLHTGRTHQIRVHLRFLGHSIVGDTVYGRGGDDSGFKGVALHSHRLGFLHPGSKKRVVFESPMPEDMRALIEA